MSQWAGIEATPAGAPAVRYRRPASSAKRPPRRLRRQERLVVGSIDSAAHVLQRRAREVLVGSAAFLVPIVALNLWLAVVAYDRFDRFDDLLADRAYLGAEAGHALLSLMALSLSSAVVGMYNATFLVRYQLGGEPRIGACVRATAARLPLVVLCWALTHGWLLLLGLAFVNSTGGSTAGIAILAAPFAAWLSAAFVVLVPVLAVERFGLRSIRRSWRLVRPRFSAAFGFVVACSVLGGLLYLFIAYLPYLAELTGLVTFGSLGWLVQGVTAQLAILVVVPFSALATAQFYLQLRIHVEGMDIVLAAEDAFGARS